VKGHHQLVRGCTNREMRKVVLAALAAGLRYRTTKAGLIFYAENGVDTVAIHMTCSDHRASKNAIASFRKIGFDPLEKRAP
jgi:hypothetical protein